MLQSSNHNFLILLAFNSKHLDHDYSCHKIKLIKIRTWEKITVKDIRKLYRLLMNYRQEEMRKDIRPTQWEPPPEQGISIYHVLQPAQEGQYRPM